MSTRIALTHTIEWRYGRRVPLPTYWLRLRPAPHTKAGVEAYSLRIGADPHFLNWVRDPFENHLARLDLPEPVASLSMTVDLVADLTPVNPFDFLTEPNASAFPVEYPEQLRKELGPYLHLPPAGPKLTAFLNDLDPEPAYIVEKLGKLTASAHRALPVEGDAQPGAVDLEAVLTRGRGSPWEAAWLLTLSLRALGLAARFVAGYRVFLAMEAVPVHAWSGDGGGGVAPLWLDSASAHAWTEVYLPGAGWIGLDPSAGLFTHEGYIPLTATPDPLRALPWVPEAPEPGQPAVAPVPAEVREQIAIRRLIPAPAPAPYTEAQWADLRAVGRQVDATLAAAGLALAMAPGLCLTVPDSGLPEWRTVAVGPRKRAAAEELLTRLRQRLAPGGVVHESQGEWFSGEPLPRWKLNCYFRADGQPLWHNPPLLGGSRAATPGPLPQGRAPSPRQTPPGADHLAAPETEDAAAFAGNLAERLGLAREFVIAAHEDQLHELWLNRAHIQFEPPPETLRNPVQRRALAVKLSRTRMTPVGYALPLRWDAVAGRWSSGRWRFRRGALYLAPGDSPLGYRLPLEGLPAGDEAPAPIDPERCPFDERAPLPALHGEPSARLTRIVAGGAAPEPADPDQPSPRAPRTALCVQYRQGRIAVFMPPLTHLEHWLDLVAAIEATALALGLPVRLEGYEPPEDFRLRRLTLEPDAGVLRLSLPQAEDWDGLGDVLGTAYAEAAALGLAAERIAEDGTHRPPGGQAEIVLGGPTPARSPFLSRPSLLHSLIAYWQRHPALSYFFAGRLVGPSGPAPRPDEGRADALYELDIALARLPETDAVSPWMPDRMLRHLLADPAGDIRKAEIRIDQLYPPDRSSQRQGRIALRGFETPADPRLALAQSLLIRGLISHLARNPTDPRATDHGPALHDRHLLPAVLWEDLEEVLRDLERTGLPLRPEWFAPFMAGRFPRLGRIDIGDVGLELRTAHEPWPVLSEEVLAGGVTRFIDSANQRIQVELSGLTPTRHVLVCNGERVPLQATRTRGRYLAGVRYKAWNPPSSLHPTVPPVYALVFDLLDARSGEVLGGCTWFPARPGLSGLAAGSLPQPEPDALNPPDKRRPQATVLPPWNPGGRFLAFGSGARRVAVPEPRPHPRFVYLLDLTRLN